jgi:hypothetical protein
MTVHREQTRTGTSWLQSGRVQGNRRREPRLCFTAVNVKAIQQVRRTGHDGAEQVGAARELCLSPGSECAVQPSAGQLQRLGGDAAGGCSKSSVVSLISRRRFRDVQREANDPRIAIIRCRRGREDAHPARLMRALRKVTRNAPADCHRVVAAQCVSARPRYVERCGSQRQGTRRRKPHTRPKGHPQAPHRELEHAHELAQHPSFWRSSRPRPRPPAPAREKTKRGKGGRRRLAR